MASSRVPARQGVLMRGAGLAIMLLACISALIWSLTLAEIPLQIRYVLAIFAGALLIPLLRVVATAAGAQLTTWRDGDAKAPNLDDIFYEAVDILCDFRIPERHDKKEAPNDVTLVRVRMALTIRRSLAGRNRPMAITFAIPAMPGRLPEGVFDREVGFRTVHINDRVLSQHELQSYSHSLHNNLHATRDDQVSTPNFHLELRPGESSRVTVEYVLLKKLFDLEMFKWRYPVKSLRLTAFDQTGLDLALYARAPSGTTFEQAISADAGGVHIWEVRDELVADEGLILWWERNEVPVARLSRPKEPAA